MIVQNGKFNEASIRNNIRLLKALVEDMEAFLDRNGPTKEVLEQSPVIDHWSMSERNTPCLTGSFYHHPILGELIPNGITSQLWLLNKDEGWARTLSRFYKLGKPLVR
ncbi:hypothetical protein FHS77_003200 [Paenochrobactrum gallinarii]|uniref:Uncharacterized protein n=1 Tax=Paenochrobactrum gallinarii TaxID=643673 RepID=A0A841M920_9HYPH|nr:DUF6634 family protein [Paenochrobactrum gallinarii]MBB6262618.1 hypothetical protein [Paenochrobactrum gallinarii]